MRFSRMAKNGKLGDGCIIKPYKNASMSFTSTDLNVINFKRKMCIEEGFTFGEIGTQKSGYGGTKTIYKFNTHVDERITQVADASYTDLIKTLDKEDLFLWYIDDGSWHKTRNTMHLYSNMLNDDETSELIAKIDEIYGIAPRARKDRKRDGRSFNYLYFPRDLVKLFRPEFKEYLIELKLESMYYKFGGLDYEEKTA
ncbi:hypothetical protein [Cytobacillus gottheilii]|uniref:Homing endonuclease LAGLIDADG domain-containing protein n=1 Tax=Cytobacillus gottheilii TaxID=859144 RepID=A0ABX8FG16_9BACI|nr:hypothetical protein [Cytobacillus gottheilii]QVY62957.1 hypothetical protein J1899_07910 [Cytobacillus gottheilii]